jgi:hypothetical protein
MMKCLAINDQRLAGMLTGTTRRREGFIFVEYIGGRKGREK